MRATVYCNRHDKEFHEGVKERLDKLKINYCLIPTSGPYTLWLRETEGPHWFRGPTDVGRGLDYLECM